MFLGQIFVKNAKHDPKTLFERPKPGKFENRKNDEILVNMKKLSRFPR